MKSLQKIKSIVKNLVPGTKVNFIDVGSIGKLPNPWNKNADRLGHILKFEPQDTVSNAGKVITKDVALWKEPGERDFYIYKGLNHTGSSLFEQNYDYVKAHFEELKSRGPEQLASTWFDRSQLVRTEKIQCTTLDNVLSEIKKVRYDFLKIDAQGAEYEILLGAEKFLQTDCIGLQLELFQIPLYKGIKLFDEVKGFLEEKGFELALKMPPHGSFDSQNDCVFFKTGLNGRQQDKLRVIKEIYRIE